MRIMIFLASELHNLTQLRHPLFNFPPRHSTDGKSKADVLGDCLGRKQGVRLKYKTYSAFARR